MTARRFEQVDLFAPVSATRGATSSRGEDPRIPHIKRFSDGYRVWNPMVRNYVGDAHMRPFVDAASASDLQRALYMEMAASGSAPAKVMQKAATMRAEGGDLFGVAAAVRPTGEQRGFKFNGRVSAKDRVARALVLADLATIRSTPGYYNKLPTPVQAHSQLIQQHFNAGRERLREMGVEPGRYFKIAQSVPHGVSMTWEDFDRWSASSGEHPAPVGPGGLSCGEARKPNPFVIVDKRGHREIPAVFSSRKEAGLARGYLEAAEGARGLRVRATTAVENAQGSKRNGILRAPPPRSLIRVELIAGGYGGTADPTVRVMRFTAVEPLEGYGKKAKSHRFPIDELIAREAGGQAVLDGKKVVGVVFRNVDRNDSGASVAMRAVAALAQELYGDPTALRAQVDYAKRNNARRSRAPEPSFYPVTLGGDVAYVVVQEQPDRTFMARVFSPRVLAHHEDQKGVGGFVAHADIHPTKPAAVDAGIREAHAFLRRGDSGVSDAIRLHQMGALNNIKYNDPRRSRLPAPSFDPYAYGRPIYADEARPAKPTRRSMEQYEAISMLKPNPGRGRTLPATVERCVAHVGPRRVEELGEREGLSSAIAICTAQGQRRGQLHKGTRTPTKKGRRDERNARRRVGFAEDERAVARMAKAARKKNGTKHAASGDVFVYRNLHTGTWSVKALRGPSKGRVVGHPDDVTVANVEFRVNAAGRDRVRAECVKGVHAGVVGTIDESGIPADYPAHLVVEVGYNPFLFDSFVLLANRVPLHRAAFVRMPPQPRGGARPLVAALYPEDAHLLDVPPVAVDPDRAARMRDCRERNAKRGGRRRG